MSLTIKELSKQFDTIPVLQNINLEIRQGEFLVLLGPSGCGKSTLLNCVTGLEAIEDGGSILINGQEVTDKAPRDRNIAMVFQSYALYPTMTVRKNITFGLQCRKVPKAQIEQTLLKTVELLQISDLLDRKPASLSGGQRQRVAIARALVHEPDVFLLDEPMSNLDAKLRAEMRVELKNLHRRLNATIVFVTHDQVEAMTLATKIAVLNQGVLQQVGNPDEVYRTPENRFVAEFIGSPSMNFISGKLDTGFIEEHKKLLEIPRESKNLALVGSAIVLHTFNGFENRGRNSKLKPWKYTARRSSLSNNSLS